MNTRAIHFRLIFWYSGMAVMVSLAFGAYTYRSVQMRLYAEMEQTLTRRATQIAGNVLAHVPVENRGKIASRIHAVYSPEAGSHFIRILRSDHSILYVSGIPKDDAFDPRQVPLPPDNDPRV
ncbi:MAG: hypothetical protein KGJ21_05340, partial [Pseudomonadota bacterium]|nr:hypothetical protein [Pseudomonadota bacterium]